MRSLMVHVALYVLVHVLFLCASIDEVIDGALLRPSWHRRLQRRRDH